MDERRLNALRALIRIVLHLAFAKGCSTMRMKKMSVWLLISLLAGLGLALPRTSVTAQSSDPPRRVNVPYFPTEVTWAETAIFWFGENEQGVPSRNYTDMRVAYTAEALRIRATIVDYYLWYKVNPTASDDLTEYDAVAIYLDTDFDRAAAPQTDDYIFLVGAHHWPNENATQYHRQARGTGTGWDTTWTGDWTDYEGMQWNCNPGPNSNECGIDYGWTTIFTIPWGTLGLSGPPSGDTLLGLGVQLYDRDDEPPAGYVAPEHWPEAFDASSPVTWGELHFGYAAYQPSSATPGGVTEIRATSPTDNTVEDAWMGGGGLCAGGHEGGSETNHGDDAALFVGTETAPTHFPCFNKSYLRFSLDAIPAGGEIISASLTLHLWGNAGAPGQAQPSWVHLFTVSDPWDEMTIHWNNAPLAQENVSAIWLYPYSRPGDIQWPGDSYTWDATQAVAEAYAVGQPVSLAIYGSDTAQHSSKYLTSSEAGDWNVAGRPVLRIRWGTAATALDKTAFSSVATYGEAITYTLTVVGNGQPLTLTDYLPRAVNPPIRHSTSLTYTFHRLTWTGTPEMGESLAFTYAVSVPVPSGTTPWPSVALWNQAILTSTNGLTDTATALVLVDPHSGDDHRFGH
jgi:hypothetical protein